MSAFARLLSSALFAAVASAQLRTDAIFARYTPNSFSTAKPAPVLVELETGKSIDRVTLELIPVGALAASRFVELHDDGADGDVSAGDSIFSIRIDVATLTAQVNPTRILPLGPLHLYSGGSEVLSAWAGLPALKLDTPQAEITSVDQRLRYSRRVANLKVTREEFLTVAQDFTWATRLFYKYFQDDFDFINVVWEGCTFQNPGHVGVRSAISGIGLRYDGGASFGSASRLLGLNVFRIDGGFNLYEGGHVFLHEMGHQWINGMSHPALKDPWGGGHWPMSDLSQGLMGFSNPFNGEGIGFGGVLVPEGSGYRVRPPIAAPHYTDLDLYLMGFRDASKVGPHFVFQNQDQLSQAGEGGFLSGPVTYVTINDVIGQEGPRVPSFADSQKQFRMATIFISVDRFLEPEELAWYDYSARLAGVVFSAATEGQAGIDAAIESSFTSGAPDTHRTGR